MSLVRIILATAVCSGATNIGQAYGETPCKFVALDPLTHRSRPAVNGSAQPHTHPFMFQGAESLTSVPKTNSEGRNGIPTITNSIGMKLVTIRKGEFQMGSEELPSELPIHKVRLTKDFYLAAHPVTVGQFKKFVKETGFKTDAEMIGKSAVGIDLDAQWFSSKGNYHWQKPGFEQADDHPVVCVNWHDAEGFCKWLSKKEGKTYRLPTEAEFEYAARAGTTTRFSYGEADESLKGNANLADAALLTKMDKKIANQAAPKGNKSGGIAAWDDGFPFTSPVTRFKANPWGLFDMHGNVWTWCNDWSVNRYQPGPQTDPVGPATGQGRVIRGGSWSMGPLRCRSANRVQRDPAAAFCYVGIRIARDVD